MWAPPAWSPVKWKKPPPICSEPWIWIRSCYPLARRSSRSIESKGTPKRPLPWRVKCGAPWVTRPSMGSGNHGIKRVISHQTKTECLRFVGRLHTMWMIGNRGTHTVNTSTSKLLLILVALGAAVYGQTITGDLVVGVTDPSGAVVSGATLSLTNVETNVKLSAVTDSTGTNLFSELKPGRYQLEVTAAGFQKSNVTDIAIALGQRAH